ncbi:MAG TPA: hypothetical protein VNR70_01785 [Steroidobacteraceae bacterium]|nr:hypothetical protein [Steroidobacteraceae bacterium]
MTTGLTVAPVQGVAQSRGARILLSLTALVTAALLLWTHALSLGGGTQGLTPIFFFLFAIGDAAAFKCALVIVVAAAVVYADRFGTVWSAAIKP